MKHRRATIADLDRRRARVLAELHPELRVRVAAVLVDTGGRFAPYVGFRGQVDQDRAFAEGHSRARFGQSPHNFRPHALACDVVLNPALVRVRAHPENRDYPDLWDDTSSEALQAWNDLERAAVAHHLERIDLAPGKRDRPHLQLPAWRSYVPQ